LEQRRQNPHVDVPAEDLYDANLDMTSEVAADVDIFDEPLSPRSLAGITREMLADMDSRGL